MNTSDKLFYSCGVSHSRPHKGAIFRRINCRHPFLKVAVIIIIAVFIFNSFNSAISQIPDPENQISIAPMSQHVRVTKRDLTGKKLVALTFDDGPSALTTPILLDILKDKDVPVTFFMLGTGMDRYPDIARRAEAEGHEVASHTTWHQNLIELTSSDIQFDVANANLIFQNILGHSPTFTRPPYGNFNNAVISAVGTPLILWSVDSLDWLNKDKNAILNTVENRAFDGAIILLHDIYGTTTDAIGPLVDELRAQGYDFVTVSEMAKIRGVEMVAGEVYRGFPN